VNGGTVTEGRALVACNRGNVTAPHGSSRLFSPARVGNLLLPNRVVMAPMTRSRAGNEGVPSPLAATYYAQRATAGLIISEAAYVAPEGVGYPCTPGIQIGRAHV